MNNTKELVLATSKKATKGKKVLTSTKSKAFVNEVVNEVPTKESKPKKPTLFLSEGITSKDLRKSQLEANKLYKSELKSPTQAFNFFVKYFSEFTKSIVGYSESEIKPSESFLNTYRTEKEMALNTFSPYLYSELVKRYYKSKSTK